MTSPPPVSAPTPALTPAGRKGFDWSNLGLRALSAAVLAPGAILAVWLGGPLLLVAMSVAVALLALEWGRMAAPGAPTRAGAAVLVGVLAAFFTDYLGHPQIAWISLAVAAVLVAVAALAFRLTRRPADTAFGVLYLGAPAVALWWLRLGPPAHGDDAGRAWVFLLFAIAWGADIAAFLIGSLLKGPKLWPRFSPNKTWSGFWGGLVMGVLLGALAAALLQPLGAPSPAFAAVVGFVGALATMGGDLLESMLKRRFGVKDSGDLIPGHGGLLDRVDGLMFATLAVAGARLLWDAGVGR